SVKAELQQAVENFRYYGSAIASIGGRANPIGGSLLFYSLKEPVGVAAQIVPWNYPLMMATWKLAPALAAGCSAVLKPDPQPPPWSTSSSPGQGGERRSGRRAERPVSADFVSRRTGLARATRVGDPLDPDTHMGSLIPGAHRGRVQGYVERGAGEARRSSPG